MTAFVDVLCVVTPDGGVTFATPRRGAADEIMAAFRASLEPEERTAHTAAKTMGGAVMLRLRPEDAAKLAVLP